MLRKTLRLTLAAALVVAATAHAQSPVGVFADQKSQLMLNLRAQTALMAQLEQCIELATDDAALARCHKTHLAGMREMFQRHPLPAAPAAVGSPLRKN